jgi:hypothetical protein
MMTVRPSAFPADPPSSSPPAAAPAQELDAALMQPLGEAAASGAQFESEEMAKSERPELGSAR